jgi:exodeoxyribonuclease VII large subunit
MSIRPEAQPTGAPPGTFGLRILAVGDVARLVRGAVAADERLRDLWIEGEVGRVTISTAGHAYFALKDERAQLQCVWFRDDRARSVFQPQVGLRIVVHGRIDLYEPQGALQIYVESIQPAGMGDLALRFEALKARLAAEGLFDQARKRALPSRPGTIAVITSPGGAVWRDVCHILRRRWPLTRVVLVACQVQGDGAPASIVTAIRRLERYAARCLEDDRPDDAPGVTIVARGGGSLEDLWAFNDERVVRAIVAHPMPVVAGIGHEIDVTLTDFAADVRAPTPSAAAEIVVPDRAEYAAALRRASDRLRSAAAREVEMARRHVEAERRMLAGLAPAVRLANARERASGLLDRATALVLAQLEANGRRMERTAQALPVLAAGRVGRARSGLAAATAALSVLGPYATLDRGYAIVRRAADGRVVRTPSEAPLGTHLAVQLAGGELAATVDRSGA